VATRFLSARRSKSTTDGKPKKSKAAIIVELVVTVATAVGLALGIQAWVVQSALVLPTGSMEPTLQGGQRVLINRIGMDFSEPHVGEIASFHPPEGAKQQLCGYRLRLYTEACPEPLPHKASVNFIKRIVAGPGDMIYIREGHVYRKAAGRRTFVRERDAYIKACGTATECNFPKAITISAGHWFMMGDNRGRSDDSRFWGPVPTGWIVGEVFLTYWPLDRIGSL
jgi:signal peptidase I